MLMVVSCAVDLIFLCALVKIGYSALLVRRTAFDFFLCHHKQGGGGFDRLLKAWLKKDQRVSRQVFLGADDVQDLNILFYVRTAEILSRLWCVGEMTKARSHNIDTILVILRDFPWPSADFIDNHSTYVEGVLF